MVQEILSYCSPSEINDCVNDSLAIINEKGWTGQPYFNSSLQEVEQENKKLSLSIGTVRSSKFASILENDDYKRDRILSGLTQVTRASMLREDASVVEKATEVYRVIKAHGLDLRNKSYQSESAGIDSLLNELNSEKMKAMVDALPETKAFLLELIPANEQFKSNFDENMAHKADTEKLSSPSIQKKVVRNLFNTKIVKYVNLMSEIDPEKFKTLSKKIEPYTERINLNAKARRTKKTQETKIKPEVN